MCLCVPLCVCRSEDFEGEVGVSGGGRMWTGQSKENAMCVE